MKTIAEDKQWEIKVQLIYYLEVNCESFKAKYCVKQLILQIKTQGLPVSLYIVNDQEQLSHLSLCCIIET